MSKNLIKQLQLQIKTHHQKFVNSIKHDLNKEYDKKFADMIQNFKNRESKIKKVYHAFLNKIDNFNEQQNKYNTELKLQVTKVNEMYEIECSKRKKINKKMEEMKRNIQIEINKETAQYVKSKKKLEDDIDVMKKKVDSKIVEMQQESNNDDMKILFSSLVT